MTEINENELELEFNKRYAKKIKRIKQKNFLRKKKSELKALKVNDRKSRGLTTTKLLCYYLFIIFNVVLIYALVAMWHFSDLSYLGMVITDILGQILVYMIYSIRAFKDTQSEEAIKLERDKIDVLPDSLRDKINTLLDKIDSNDNNEVC